jgi:hypothetical protein
LFYWATTVWHFCFHAMTALTNNFLLSQLLIHYVLVSSWHMVWIKRTHEHDVFWLQKLGNTCTWLDESPKISLYHLLAWHIRKFSFRCDRSVPSYTASHIKSYACIMCSSSAVVLKLEVNRFLDPQFVFYFYDAQLKWLHDQSKFKTLPLLCRKSPCSLWNQGNSFIICLETLSQHARPA